MPSGYKTSDVPSIYQPLFDLLADTTGDEVTLTFQEIAALIGRRYLPEAAVLHNSWWTNKRAAQVQTWTVLGWRAQAEGNNHRVRFTREAEG